jgi:hypothetical protein
MFRAEVEHAMGYDPFKRSDARERLVVLLLGEAGVFSAHVQRFNAAGVSTWDETFTPRDSPRGACAAALFPSLASYIDGLYLSSKATPAPPPAAPSERAAPAPSPLPASPPELRAPPPPASPPEPPNVPNPTRAKALGVAIGGFSVGAVFLGLGIGWSVYGHNKANAAQALTAQTPAGGVAVCFATNADSGGYCGRLFRAWQSRDATLRLRDGWFAAAGVSAAVGAIATVWAVSLPMIINGLPQAQVNVRPGGLALSGSF